MRIAYSALLPTLLLISSITAAEPAKLAPVLQPYIDNQILAGAVVLVGDKQRVLDVEAVGFMDVAAKRPMQTDAMFWIASQSKPLTCTALMMLVDEGKLSVDDPVEKYLPEFKGQWYVAEQSDTQQVLKKPSRPMRVRDLMSHTSGLPKSTAVMKPTLDGATLEKSVQANSMLALDSEPGTKYVYANPGMNTVGRIVEVVSGMPYERFMETRIFNPLGMKDTTFWPNEEQLKRLAKSYKPTDDKKGLQETTVEQLRYPLSDRTRHAFPGGGLFSTAADLFNFYRMIANDGTFAGQQILSKSAVEKMTTNQTGPANFSYGFGFHLRKGTIGHGGAYGTMSTYDPESQLITIYLVQHASWSGNGKDIVDEFQKAAKEKFSGEKTTKKAASVPNTNEHQRLVSLVDTDVQQ